jgi:hypothetical protein
MTPDLHTLASLPDSPSQWLDSYPDYLSRTWTLSTGESLRVRPVRHEDGEFEEAFVRGLSLESRYQRMLSAGTKITPEWIDSMTHIDYQRHMAFAVMRVIDGIEQFVGVGRYVVDAATLTADVALVRPDLDDGLEDRRIRVNAVSPGSTDTPGLSELLASSETGQERLKMISNNVPLGRLGTPDEIAKAVVFLASDDSSYITGTELFVDGGFAQV